MDLFSADFKQKTSIVKYQYDKNSKEFYCFLTYPSVAAWIDDDLSREAMALLLVFSAAIKENYDWDVRYSKFKSPVFNDVDKLKGAYKELKEKGYAIECGGKYILRNDKRVPFPNGAPAQTQTSSFSWNEPKKKEEDYVPEWQRNGEFDSITLEDRIREARGW